jgi:hypothetical protein
MIKKIIKWFLKLFKKNRKEIQKTQPIFTYDIVKDTSCHKHVWVNHPKYGMIRKPNGWLK